jgi:hypothetical protein
MRGAVTVHMNAPAQPIWDLVADVRNTGRFSPETFDAEWLDDVPGHRMRSGPRVQFRSPAREPLRQ